MRHPVDHALSLANRTGASVTVGLVKAIAVQAFGGPEGLAVIDLPTPEPAAGQVLIATEAIGVGGVDAMIRSGALAAYGFQGGHILGGEVAGIVTAAGAGADPSWVGRRAWGFTGVGGGYAEQAVVPAASLVPIPAALSAVDAVTLGSSGVVAHFGLRHARFAPGESLLVRGAAGGIGIMAVQLAARAGAGTIAITTSSAQRGDRLRALGATHVLDRAGEGPPDSFDVVIDVVAGPDLPAFLGKLNPNGRLVAAGAVAGDPPADFGARLFQTFRKSLSFATFSADTVPWADRRTVIANLFAAATRGELQAVVHDVLPLDQAVDAHRRMQAGEVFGRTVLTGGPQHTTGQVRDRATP